MSRLNINIAGTSIIAALYVVITLVMAPVSFGVIQLRISEMFNHLAIFNKRYIWAVTLGVLIVNMFSPLGPIDMLFGTAGTLLGTTLTYYLTKYSKSMLGKYAIATICQLPGMFLVDVEMHLYMGLPIFPTYWILALGEILSMVVGAILINLLAKKIDFTK
ncbi:QueT transporter family protein [Pediococcus stilesii]|uniref:QueT transporter family protein n=1 Tax=Pediococcus stilesii TaxID=331679 RepID=A0A5R9BXU5_9LACO|nr:QueT transporter family protein [Pediococcus stilesii]TLQ05467.1 QueT transporter family protein [Pediococcus stilesii]